MRITEDEYQRILKRNQVVSKPSKYRNVKTIVDGIRFDSKLESRYYEYLKSLGVSFIRQASFHLEGGVKYVCDFFIWDITGVTVVDCTGVMTQTKRNKLKQVKARYGIEVQIVKHGDF